MRKCRGAILACFLIIGMIGLNGCGKVGRATATTVEIAKNGEITSTIVEKFEKEYYAEEELKAMIQKEINEYNLAEGSDSIKLEELIVQESAATSVIIYKNAKDYAKFNEKVFFFGTVAEAYEEGHSFDVTLKSTADETQTLDKNAILGDGGMHVILLEEPQNVKVYKNISHNSDNVTLEGKKEATVTSSDGQLAYILLK